MRFCHLLILDVYDTKNAQIFNSFKTASIIKDYDMIYIDTT